MRWDSARSLTSVHSQRDHRLQAERRSVANLCKSLVDIRNTLLEVRRVWRMHCTEAELKWRVPTALQPLVQPEEVERSVGVCDDVPLELRGGLEERGGRTGQVGGRTGQVTWR